MSIRVTKELSLIIYRTPSMNLNDWSNFCGWPTYPTTLNLSSWKGHPTEIINFQYLACDKKSRAHQYIQVKWTVISSDVRLTLYIYITNPYILTGITEIHLSSCTNFNVTCFSSLLRFCLFNRLGITKSLIKTESERTIFSRANIRQGLSW